ncbi:MAG: SIMPL domain-containing protein [Parasphingorhabdus sp.]
MKFSYMALAASLLAATIVSPAWAADVQIVAQNPVIELSVSEQVRSTPDKAFFSTGVQTKAPTATQALRDNSRKARILIDKLKSLGIAEKDIQTTGINLNADYRYDRPSQENRFVGYQVSNQVQATVRDISKLGMILDAMVSGGGATNLNGPHFSIDDDSEVKKLARKRALANAKSQAMSYARAEGYSGVRVLSISEGLRNVSQGPMPMARSMVAEDSMNVPVAPGQVGTTISLNITYEMVR